MKTLLVFEESSRVGFGGGQKMTLITCDLIKENFKYKFVDFTETSKFIHMLHEKYPSCETLNIGHTKSSPRNRTMVWVKAMLQMFFFYKQDLRAIIEGLDVEDTISYVTNKRGLRYAYYLNKHYNIPFVYHAHLVENPSGLYYKLFKKWVRRAFRILCVSKIVMDSINLPQCQLLYNPTLNKKGYKGEKKNDKYVVAYVGGLIPIKGVEYFVEAAKLCPQEIEFRAYGEGPLRDELERQSGGRVIFKGFSENIIGEYYNDVDIVVLPTVLKEALPLVIVDAKSVGIPAVTTKPGGQAEIIHDGKDGLCVSMRNTKEIAEALMKLCSDHEMYNRMSKAAFESSNQFSFDNYKKEILTIFKQL